MRGTLARLPRGWPLVGINITKMNREDFNDLATQASLGDSASCEGFCLYDVTFSLAEPLRPFY